MQLVRIGGGGTGWPPLLIAMDAGLDSGSGSELESGSDLALVHPALALESGSAPARPVKESGLALAHLVMEPESDSVLDSESPSDSDLAKESGLASDSRSAPCLDSRSEQRSE